MTKLRSFVFWFMFLSSLATVEGVKRLLLGDGAQNEQVIGAILLLTAAVLFVGVGTVRTIENAMKTLEEKVKPASKNQKVKP